MTHRQYKSPANAGYENPDRERSRLIAKAILRELQSAILRNDMANFGLATPVHPERMKRLVTRAIRASCMVPSGGRLG